MRSVEMNPLIGGDHGGEFDEEEDLSSRYHRADSFDLSENASLTSPQLAAMKTISTTNNLDLLFQQLYAYYHGKGFSPSVLQNLFHIAGVFSTLFIGIFLALCFRWDELNKCFLDEKECHTFSYYVQYDALNKTLLGLGVGVVLPMLAKLIVNARVNAELRRLLLMTKITTRDLQTMHWSSVVSHLRDLQQRVFFVKNGMKVNALYLAMRIMRIDNYKIFIFSSRILPLGSPPLTESFSPSNKIWYMTSLLERNLDVAFFSSGLVDSTTFTIKTKDRHTAKMTLDFQLKCLAVANFLLMPGIVVWTLVYFVFQYAEEFHSKRNYLGPRYFTPHMVWLMREYNELPHQFEKRASQGVKYSERYLKQFINPVLVVVVRGVTFCLGGVAATLLLFGLVDDSVLFRVTLWDRNLVWYFALLTSATAALRGLVPPAEDMDAMNNPNVQMRRVASFTHVYPDHWRGRANTYTVKEGFEALVPNRLLLLVRELLGACVNWYILGVVLPRYVDELIDLVNDHTIEVDGVGDVCVLSLLQVSRFGDPKWPALLQNKPLGFPSDVKITHHLVESKLEKSFLQFKLSYTKDICGLSDAVGDELLDRIRMFQKRATIADNLEQQASSQSVQELLSMSMSVMEHYHVVIPEEEAVEDAMLGE
ncbi:hypothetical protein BASA81_003618 [Batrachochytrium salamandrivorans]|nr:hypothetical protein BASA81_003618 [Batrachochytrium salamandrivorans]